MADAQPYLNIIAWTGGTSGASASAAAAIPGNSNGPDRASQLFFTNTGQYPIRLALGKSSGMAVATAADIGINPGSTLPISRGSWTHFSVIQEGGASGWSFVAGEGV